MGKNGLTLASDYIDEFVEQVQCSEGVVQRAREIASEVDLSDGIAGRSARTLVATSIYVAGLEFDSTLTPARDLR